MPTICNGDATTVLRQLTTADMPSGCPVQAGSMVNLTAQQAAISATTLFTPTVDAFYRISCYLKVTRAATTSCVLAGATGVVVTFTDPDSVAQSMIVMFGKQDGTGGISNATNSTISKLQGDVYIHAKSGVPVQYAIGYTSVGATVMQFKAILKGEQL